MANTTVNGAMFLGNTIPNIADGAGKIQNEGFSFEKAMTDATGKTQDVKTQNDDNQLKPTGKLEKSHRNPTAKDSDEAENRIDDTAENQSDKLDKAVADKVDEKVGEIKDKIKDTFGVSDEEIEEVLIALQIMPQQLMIPDDIKNVLVELSGVEDSMDLLTNENLYNGIQDVLGLVSEVSNEIQSQFGIDEAEFTSIISNEQLFVPVDEKVELDETIQLDANVVETIATGIPEIDTKADNSETVQNKETSFSTRQDIARPVDDSVRVNLSTADRTETFNNISKAEMESDNDLSQNMGSMTQTQTTITINAEGNVVETIQSFTEGFSDAREIVSQVTESVKMNISSDMTSMEMQLHPATLGTVNMQISSQNGVVTANILVQNEAVKSALESQLLILQETFEEQGHQVEAIEVTVANYNLDRGMQNGSNEQERENALRSGRAARRRLKLDEITDEEFEELTDDDKVTADMMRRQGNSVDFMA